VALVEDRRDLLALRAEDGQGRRGDAGRLLGPERPRAHRGQLLAEERVGVGHGLLERPGDGARQHLGVGRPADPAHPGLDRAGLVAGAVALDGLQAVRTGRDGQQRRFQQGQRPDRLRGVDGQLQRHVRAGGVADDVGLLDAEVAHERVAVGRLLSDADGAGDPAAAGVADAVVADQAVAAGQRRLPQQRPEPLGTDARVDQHDRLTAPPDLVLELDAPDLRAAAAAPPPARRPGAARAAARRRGSHRSRGWIAWTNAGGGSCRLARARKSATSAWLSPAETDALVGRLPAQDREIERGPPARQTDSAVVVRGG
jgi:hypothetical protein